MSATGDQPGLVRSQPPPRQVLKVVNPILCAVLESPLGRRMNGMAVLRFTGRRSGKAYKFPIGVHDIDGVATVFTDRPWRLNFSTGGPVSLTRGSRKLTGHAQLISDPGQVGPALAAAVRQAGSPRRLGLSAPKGHQPTEQELAAVGRSMIRFTFGDASPQA